mmetsp:Transcript_4236/g.10945  ORF Transcript_4236/g.10945 Transcript_4236/m.10945 type:complete len:124 (+) Transcript_4236:2-373(+)
MKNFQNQVKISPFQHCTNEEHCLSLMSHFHRIGAGDLLAMANSLSGKASAQFAVKIEQYRHLPEEIGSALQKIVYIVNGGRSSEAMDTFCHSLAFGILQRLYQMVYQCCCDFQSLPSNMSSQT